MRKIKVGSIRMSDKSSHWKKHKLYEFYTGNGSRIQFKSLRSCQAHQNDVTKTVNLAAHEINSILSKVHQTYRSYFFYFEDSGKGTRHTALEKIIKENLAMAENFQSKLYTNTHGYSGPALIFTFLNNCLESLASCVLSLLQMASIRMDNANKYHLKIILQRLQNIKLMLSAL